LQKYYPDINNVKAIKDYRLLKRIFSVNGVESKILRTEASSLRFHYLPVAKRELRFCEA